jgi:DNA modification methylase
MPDDQAKALRKSIESFDIVEPFVIDQHNRICGGHQRLDSVLALGMKQVPCVRKHLTERQFKALNLALNRISGEWDEQKLAPILAELRGLPEIDLTGFQPAEIDKLIREVMPQDENEDVIPEPPVEPVTKTGDLWVCDKHRVLCGDSTKLLAQVPDASVDQVLTDPPYGADLLIGREQLGHRTVANDEGLGWLPTIVDHCWRILKPQSICVLFGQWRTFCDFSRQFQEKGFRLRTVGVWDKKNAGLGDGLAEAYEQIHVYYKGEPKASRFTGNVFEYSRLSGRPEHPTEKPLELIRELMTLHDGEQILDPFLGSGTTLIAAQQLDRVCYGIEIEPRYVDVAVKRWENLTGKKAERITK